MMVTFQIVLGLVLVLSQHSIADGDSPRHSREKLSSSPSTPVQNATEINNRDLNKIVTDDPKTDLLDSKIKPVNNVHNLETFPLKFGKPEEDDISNSEFRDVVKDKEKHLFKGSRSIDLDTSKFWSSKNNVFTIPPLPDIDKFREPDEESFDNTHRSSFLSKFELTTPKSELFDKKFKETVESVDQTIEEGYRESKIQPEDELESDEEVLGPLGNDTNEYLQTKSIVKNETVDKNSIHRDLDIEQTRKIDFENTFNDTSTYSEETTKGDTFEPISEKIPVISTVDFTRKASFIKDSTTEKINNQILSNKIETETREPIKFITSTIIPSTTAKSKGEIENIHESESSVHIPIVTQAPNISDWDNQVVPVQFVTERKNVIIPNTPETIESSITVLPKVTELSEFVDKQHNITARLAEEGTTTEEMITTTLYTYTTILSTDTTTTSSDTTTLSTNPTTLSTDTTTLSTETTTEFTEPTTLPTESTTLNTSTMQNIESTTEIETTEMLTDNVTELSIDDISTESITTEIVQGTYKSLNILSSSSQTTTPNENITTEPSSELTPTSPVITTETTESVTITEAINDIDENIIAKHTDQNKMTETVWETISSSTTPVPTSVNTALTPETTSEEEATTTEYAFVHIEESGSNQTTLHPETLSPSLNYSTPILTNETINDIIYKKVITDNLIPYDDTTPPTISNSTATEGNTETVPTEHSLTNDGTEGTNKGKIAAIAISSVAAVCLVLLAGLLYVMKKRQRRLNYGPRCRPVSLDDYSIDNLSVYNSVRRKADRMSKRSFGNPAFEDPTSPSHPLNFPALAKFSTNVEDIRAEYEEIPQISARTSELPEGCDSKNRYANVIPLPETRVILRSLDEYENSDYINANYVTGPKNVRGYYIATQAPMQNTVDDFWRMIWEQQVKVVLMLTHLVENGLEKCVDYLPESEVLNCSRSFGDFQVILKRREVKEKYIISSIQLKNMVSNSWREVTHFWYLGWPEKGVPTEANSLIAFLIEARSYMKTMTLDNRNAVNGMQNGGTNNEHNPVVVHCSPGTGRTGVVIASDIAIREFESTRLVDIPKIVYKIRRGRAGAVQSKEQYQFIYKVVSLYATKLTGGALENF
ncbi:uncharacterized protein LOC143196660 isoform X1 [Rhynchophorus ferrugineus]|uniref:uncharacterized protein LOC143196660 isoform X1 n=1 Tax=Rhynchophorus ferrugineus TaxID=354439 RepID=UPI003FCC6D50